MGLRRILAITLSLVGATTLWTPIPAIGQEVPSATEARAALGSTDATARATAACHLGRMSEQDVRPARDRLLRLLSDGTPVHGELCRDYGRWGDGQDRGSTPGREAAIALEELGTEVLEPLVGVLEGTNPIGRENAALALGLIESVRAIPELQTALSRDAEPKVRARSAWALGMIESPDAVDALGRAVRGDDDGETRSQAAWGLGMIEDAGGVPPLIIAIGDPEAEVRTQAAWALDSLSAPTGASL